MTRNFSINKVTLCNMLLLCTASPMLFCMEEKPDRSSIVRQKNNQLEIVSNEDNQPRNALMFAQVEACLDALREQKQFEDETRKKQEEFEAATYKTLERIFEIARAAGERAKENSKRIDALELALATLGSQNSDILEEHKKKKKHTKEKRNHKKITPKPLLSSLSEGALQNSTSEVKIKHKGKHPKKHRGRTVSAPVSPVLGEGIKKSTKIVDGVSAIRRRRDKWKVDSLEVPRSSDDIIKKEKLDDSGLAQIFSPRSEGQEK